MTPVCVLDTGVIIFHLRNFRGVKERLLRLLAQGGLAVSAVTVVEVWQGMRSGESERTRALFRGIEVVPLDALLAEKAGDLVRSQREQGYTMDLADAVIAATAMELGVPLLTTNRRHFDTVAGLVVWEMGREA